MNEVIAWGNVVIGLSLIATGLVLFWQAWERGAIFEKPLSILVVLGLTPFLVGIAWGQIAIFRFYEVHGPLGPHGWGTAAYRWAVAVVVIWRLNRIVRGRLLTVADRRRMNGGSG